MLPNFCALTTFIITQEASPLLKQVSSIFYKLARYLMLDL